MRNCKKNTKDGKKSTIRTANQARHQAGSRKQNPFILQYHLVLPRSNSQPYNGRGYFLVLTDWLFDLLPGHQTQTKPSSRTINREDIPYLLDGRLPTKLSGISVIRMNGIGHSKLATTRTDRQNSQNPMNGTLCTTFVQLKFKYRDIKPTPTENTDEAILNLSTAEIENRIKRKPNHTEFAFTLPDYQSISPYSFLNAAHSINCSVASGRIV